MAFRLRAERNEEAGNASYPEPWRQEGGEESGPRPDVATETLGRKCGASGEGGGDPWGVPAQVA